MPTSKNLLLAILSMDSYNRGYGAGTILRVLALVLLMIGLSSCWSAEEVIRNVRVIAKAEVAEEVVEGSAVMSLRWRAGDFGRVYGASRTEAVILKLKDRGTVYVLDGFIKRDIARSLYNSAYWHSAVLWALGINRSVQDDNFPQIREASGRFPVVPNTTGGAPSTLPLMVTLADEAHLETMRRVLPEDFPREFGDDVRFLGLWFEFTEDPPTEKIPARLPVAVTMNESFPHAFPRRDSNGELIPAVDKAFPHKVGKSAFVKRTF